MSYTREFLRRIVKAAQVANQQHLGCEECWQQVDRFAEMHLAGKSPEEAMPLVAEHLEKCGACQEEYRALLEALRATTEVGSL